MKVYTFSAPMNMICDMTNSLVANPGPKFSIDKCDVGSYFEVEDILCPAVNLFYLLFFVIYRNSPSANGE